MFSAFRYAALLACLAAPLRADVLVLAAASLKEPVDVITAEAGVPVTVSYGGSGTQARQVLFGAPADIVILASVAWMEVLAEEGALSEAVPPRDVARNRLVVIAPKGTAPVELTAAGLEAARDGGRIAVGLVEAVPAGIYAKAALETLGLWDGAAPHLAEAENVRMALALVERGQAPIGITYVTDAAVSDAVEIVAEIPDESHPPIRYLAALTKDASPEALAVFERLTGPEGAAAFAAAGFAPVPE